MSCNHVWVTVDEDEDYKYQECVMPSCGARNLVSKPRRRR